MNFEETIRIIIFFFLGALSIFDGIHRKVPQDLLVYFFFSLMVFWSYALPETGIGLIESIMTWWAVSFLMTFILRKPALGSADQKLLSILTPLVPLGFLQIWLIALGGGGFLMGLLFKKSTGESTFAFVPALFLSFFILEICRHLL